MLPVLLDQVHTYLLYQALKLVVCLLEAAIQDQPGWNPPFDPAHLALMLKLHRLLLLLLLDGRVFFLRQCRHRHHGGTGSYCCVLLLHCCARFHGSCQC